MPLLLTLLHNLPPSTPKSRPQSPPYAPQDAFTAAAAAEASGRQSMSFTLSMVEIYNEAVHDLLGSASKSSLPIPAGAASATRPSATAGSSAAVRGEGKALELRLGPQGVFVEGLAKHAVQTVEETLQLLVRRWRSLPLARSRGRSGNALR
jgi:hypothetical protein